MRPGSPGSAGGPESRDSRAADGREELHRRVLEGPARCTLCGGVGDAAARLTWVRSVDRDRVRWSCERCARENLRSIEGRLDEQWW